MLDRIKADRWTQGLGSGIAEVREFRMNVQTNFAAIDFPAPMTA